MKPIVMAAVSAAFLLAGCGEGQDPSQDAADVADIRANHDNPPPIPIDPERISYNDIEKNDLYGAGCGFAPGTGMAVIALAQPERGFLKLGGAIVTLSPDKGGQSLPLGAWQDYSGSDFAFELRRLAPESTSEGIETTSWPGALTITDRKGRPVYEAEGTLQCGS